VCVALKDNPSDNSVMKALIRLLAAALAALVSTASIAQNQDYPVRPIRLIVPFSAGGPTDATARAVAQKMGALLGRQMVVENRTGAGAIVGSELVAKAPADGYTLLFGTFSMAISATLYPKLPYDTLDDFAPIGQVANTYLVLAVPASSPSHTLQEFIAMVRAAPEKVNYGSSGIGGGMHLASEMFLARSGLQGVTHVPYRGNSMVVPALLAGDLSFGFLGMDSAVPYIQSGNLRALAVTSPLRDPLLPEVPTFAEAGLPGVEVGIWFVIEAPKNTPSAVVNKLNATLNAALNSPELQAMSSKFAGTVLLAGSTPQSTRAFIRDEIIRWAPVVTSLSAKPE
jgi:tripartite-type tricarboxylate transporter receptor subunit TctC